MRMTQTTVTCGWLADVCLRADIQILSWLRAGGAAPARSKGVGLDWAQSIRSCILKSLELRRN
jgi:hypothetical protein